MRPVEDILRVFETGQKSVNIECTSGEHVLLLESLLPALKSQRVARLSKDEALYDFMSVKQYLDFFADIIGSTRDSFELVELFKLERFLWVKISKLTPSVQRRVLFARGLIGDPDVLVFEEPLLDVDHESARIIVAAIEFLAERGTAILCTSNSFRTVSLLPGNSYHVREASLVPIFESLDFIPHENEDASHPIIEIKSEGRTLLVPIEDILFAESIDSVCHIYIKNSYVSTNFTLEDLEAKLKDYNFFRSHRSYLVNVTCVREIQQWTRNTYVLTLKDLDAIEIPLSKRRYHDFKEQLHSA